LANKRAPSAGKMTINIAGGRHSFGFDYTIPESH
jgi:hypothetical protein